MKEKNKGKEPPAFMNTHPSSQKRIENLDGWVNEIILDKRLGFTFISGFTSFFLVSRVGLEPTTHSLKGNCSTN